MANFNIDKVRADFPVLSQKVYNKPLVYFDNGATTQKPLPVIDVINQYYSELNSSIHRGVHFLSDQATNAYENARETVRHFINAAKAHEIIFTSGTTMSINLLAFSLGEKYIHKGDEIIITEMEHHGDTLTHQIISLLHRTFVTPFDREDIALLAHTMDDIIDFIHAAADAIFIYKIKEPKERAKELADIILKGVKEVEYAVSGMRRRSQLRNVLERCVEINRLENMADRVYRAAMAELFESSDDIADIIKWREIYGHLESATDRCEDVANVLEGVALKHA